jgi:hypothetical protein
MVELNHVMRLPAREVVAEVNRHVSYKKNSKFLRRAFREQGSSSNNGF